MLWQRAPFLSQRSRTILSRYSTSHNWFSSSSGNSAPSFFSWYSQKLDTHPLLTKAISSGIIAAAGDGICQLLSDDDNYEKTDWTFDLLRNCRFFVMGAFWVAPCTHTWYGLLSKRIFPGPSTLQRTTQRVVLDQFGFAVLFQSSFMGLLWFLEGRSNILENLKDVMPNVLVANWSLWIPAMSFNFAFVPIKFQVLFGNVVALLWNTYLSYMSAQSKKRQQTIESTSNSE
jgi:hypothetical protein